MTPTLTQMQTWFKEFNATVFRNTLPTVKINFTNTRCQLGQFYWGNCRGIGIKISLFWDRTEEQYRNCLLHEMCHLYCYSRGWMGERHGGRWKQIARFASNMTGLNIQRCTDITDWEVSSGNEAKMLAVQEKENAPAILLDLCYDNNHFIVKTTKKVLLSGDTIDGDYKVKTTAKSYRVFVSDAPRFRLWRKSRSIHRGYRFENLQYEKEIKPLLDKAIEVENLWDMFQGNYDRLGIR